MSKKQKSRSSEKDKKFPLPVYRKEDDIYNREKEEPLEDEDQPTKRKSGRIDKASEDDPDMPRTELGDAGEVVGEDDGENNY